MTAPGSNPTDSYREAFAHFMPPDGRDSALAALRARAMDTFVKQGFPSLRDEDWRYTNLRTLARQQFRLSAGEPADLAAEAVQAVSFDLADALRLVFVDGVYSARLSDETSGTEGVTLSSLGTMFGQASPALPESLGNVADIERHRFAALNSAFMSDGCLIDIQADVALRQPVYLLFVSTAGTAPLAVHPRVLIRAAAGAQLTVLQHHVATGDNRNFINAVTEIDLGPGASLVHCKVQDESTGAYHLSGTHVLQRRDSRLTNHGIDLGGRLVRHDLHVALSEPGAELVLNGLFMADGRQHVDNHTRVDHLAPHTTSEEDYRGVVDGRGRGVFNGKVVVHPGADKIAAQQSNRNLLLADTAEVDTKPELEIYADDVQCSHGATVGQLDQDALFYLLSRGLDTETARGLLTFAFADGVVARIGIPGVRARLEERIVGRLPDHELIREFV